MSTGSTAWHQVVASRLTETEYQQLQQLAEVHDSTVSRQVRRAILDRLATTSNGPQAADATTAS